MAEEAEGAGEGGPRPLEEEEEELLVKALGERALGERLRSDIAAVEGERVGLGLGSGRSIGLVSALGVVGKGWKRGEDPPEESRRWWPTLPPLGEEGPLLERDRERV